MTEIDVLARRTDKQLSIHEAVCAERYQKLEDAAVVAAARMQRVEYILYLVAALCFMGSPHIGELLKSVIVK